MYAHLAPLRRAEFISHCILFDVCVFIVIGFLFVFTVNNAFVLATIFWTLILSYRNSLVSFYIKWSYFFILIGILFKHFFVYLLLINSGLHLIFGLITGLISIVSD